MRPRRIVLVTESFHPAVDGSTTTLRHVADHLVDTGREVSIVAPGPGLSSYRSVPVVRIVPGRRGSQVRSALTDLAPDLVQVAGSGAVGRRALLHARRLGVPTLVVEHAPVPASGAEPWLRQVAGLADAVAVTSPWMARRTAALGVGATVWEPGVDTDAFTPALRDAWLHRTWARSRSRGGPLLVVGYAGPLRTRHGVRALAGLAGVPGVRPVVIGDGPQRAWLERRLPGAVFRGDLGTGDLAVALASLDVLVHPGTEETCCHAHRQAAAAGIPVVAPRSGGAASVVRGCETGLLYDPADPHGLGRAVAAVAADSRRHLLGERGREVAFARSWATACAELDDLHDRILGRSALRATA